MILSGSGVESLCGAVKIASSGFPPLCAEHRSGIESRRTAVQPGTGRAGDGGVAPGSKAQPAVDDCRGLSMSSNGQYHVEAQTRSLVGVQILGTGSYVPDNVVSNLDLQS